MYHTGLIDGVDMDLTVCPSYIDAFARRYLLFSRWDGWLRSCIVGSCAGWARDFVYRIGISILFFFPSTPCPVLVQDYPSLCIPSSSDLDDCIIYRLSCVGPLYREFWNAAFLLYRHPHLHSCSPNRTHLLIRLIFSPAFHVLYTSRLPPKQARLLHTVAAFCSDDLVAPLV